MVMRSRFRRRFAVGSITLGIMSCAEATMVTPKASVPSTEVQQPTYLVVYQPGPAWLEGKPLSAQKLKEHAAYMLSLYRKDVLRFAGPFADDSGGAVMFTAKDDATAEALVKSDPAVTTSVFTYTLRRWRWVDWKARDRAATQNK